MPKSPQQFLYPVSTLVPAGDSLKDVRSYLAKAIEHPTCKGCSRITQSHYSEIVKSPTLGGSVLAKSFVKCTQLEQDQMDVHASAL